MEIEKLIKFPLKRVHIELTSVCNFNCTFCPKSKMTRKNGYMDFDLAKKIIDELSEKNITEKITFHIMGEPFIHKRFFDIIAYVKERGLKVGITTNGSYLSEENSKRLSKIGIDQVNISLQTPSADTFKMRKAKGGNYNDYCKNILYCIETLINSKKDTKIKLHFLNTKYRKAVEEAVGNLDIISSTPKLRSVFCEWVENIYKIKGISPDVKKEKVLSGISKVSANKWNVLEVYPNVFFETYVLDTWGDALRKKTNVRSTFGYCSALTDHFGILWNGDFILCCKDFDGKTKIANVGEKSITDILNSDKIISILKGFKKYKVIHPQCQICLGGPTKLRAYLKQVGSIVFFDLLKPYFYHKKKLY